MDPIIQDISKQTEIPVSEIPSPPTRRPFHKTPILLMSVFILIVIGAFFAGTYYQGMSKKAEVERVTTSSPTPSQPSPTPDPTVDWRELRGGSLLTFKIPSDWWVGDWNIAEKGESGVRINPVAIESGPNDTIPLLLLTEQKTNKTMDQVIAGFISQYGLTNVEKDSFDRNGVSYYTLEADTQTGLQNSFKMRVVVSPTGGSYYMFRNLRDLGSQSEYFDQILKTFKFLDSSASASAGK